MSNVPLFAASGSLSVIAATMNIYFLISSRYSYQPTQRFAPWLLLSSLFQAARYLTIAIGGPTPLCIQLYDLFSTCGTFAGFTYFVCYILLLLKQANLVAGRELDRKKVYVYYILHFILAAVSVIDLIVKNLRHNTATTGVKYAFYFFYTVVFLASIDYLGFRLIQFALVNATKVDVVGGQNLKTQLLNPLRKTLIFFSGVCVFGIVVFAIQGTSHLRSPIYFPSETMINTTELFSVVLLSIVNFFTTLHAWIYLDRCERRRGKDTRHGRKTNASRPPRTSLSHPRASKSIPAITEGSRTTSTTPDAEPPVSPHRSSNVPLHTDRLRVTVDISPRPSAPSADNSEHARLQPTDSALPILTVDNQQPFPASDVELQPLPRDEKTETAISVGTE